MVELRTSVHAAELEQFSARITRILQRIHPAARLSTEVHRLVVQVRIEFPLERHVDYFFDMLKLRGLELNKWKLYGSHNPGYDPYLPEELRQALEKRSIPVH